MLNAGLRPTERAKLPNRSDLITRLDISCPLTPSAFAWISKATLNHSTYIGYSQMSRSIIAIAGLILFVNSVAFAITEGGCIGPSAPKFSGEAVILPSPWGHLIPKQLPPKQLPQEKLPVVKPIDTKSFVSIPLDQAIAKALSINAEFRFGRINKSAFKVTTDYRPNRLTFEVDNNVVTACIGG